MTPASSLALAQATTVTSTGQDMLVAAKTIKADLLEAARVSAITNLSISINLLNTAVAAVSNTTAQSLLSALTTFMTGVQTEIRSTVYLHGVFATGGVTSRPSAVVATALSAFESAKGELELNGNTEAQAALPLLEVLLELTRNATDYGMDVVLPFLPKAAFGTALSGVTVQWRKAAFVSAWAAVQRLRLEALQ